MKYLLLIPLTVFAAPALSQTQAFLDQTSYVTNDGVVTSVDPAAVFTVSHGGHFRGRVSYATMNISSATGLFVEPNLVSLWSVRNEDLGYAGKFEWNGDDDNQIAMPSLSFDPLTGIGQAQLDIPMGQYIGKWSYPPLPESGTTLIFVFGVSGSLALDNTGWPVNFFHYALYSFDTAYPDVLTYADKSEIALGESVQITVVMDDTVTAPDVLLVDIIGDAQLQLKDGGPLNAWTLPIPDDTRVYAIDLVARKAGTFFARASLSSGAFGDGPWCSVSGYPATPASDNTADGPGPGGGPDTHSYRTESEKKCRPGRCNPEGGDQELECTAPFIELVQTPPNPNCVSGSVGIVIKGACVKGESYCEMIGEVAFTCPKYVYAGTVDRSAGSVEVGLKIGVEGEMNWLVAKAKTTAEFHTTVMSPISRRCCKYTPVAGETANVKILTCQ